MGPLTLAGTAGLMTGIRASDAAEQRQELEVSLSTATENVKALPYVECGTAEEYQDAYKEWVAAHPAGIIDGIETATPLIKQVTYWDEASSAFVESCKVDGGAQRFVVVAIGIDRNRSGTIVKRDPEAVPQ